MIEKMYNVYVVSTLKNKEEMLDGLREIGVLHIAERKAPRREISERFTNLSKTITALEERSKNKADKKAKKALKEEHEEKPVLKGKEFNKLYKKVNEAFEDERKNQMEISRAKAEIERLTPWGDFSPELAYYNRIRGYGFRYYRLPKEEYARAVEDPDLRFVRLGEIEGQIAIAVLISEGAMPRSYNYTEFVIPEEGISDLKKVIEEHEAKLLENYKVLDEAALYLASFKQELIRIQSEEVYSSASETAVNDDDFVWITGYVPQDSIERFKASATDKKWAWAIDNVSKDDDQIPTKLKYNKVSRLMQPIYDILGIVPGYREQDISLWFFLFFTLFFAMIIGDGGYGLIILAATIAYIVKSKGINTTSYLLLVLSIATIVWGSITGTWFGMEHAMDVPFLRALVIPDFASYPQYFGVTEQTTQNTIMKFSFTIGAIQMSLGCLLAIRKKLQVKDLSWIANLGWLIAVVGMYLMSLYLVIGVKISIYPVFGLIGVAFVMVALFGGMGPGKTFKEGIKAGLSDAFTVFLDTISCFGNVMSYIRLFAVGMAGLAISQSFNGIAAGFHGPLIIVAVIVVLIGHALNIVMCFLSVVVHGVRLNVLEFSGQVGLEWTGQAYDPFRED